MFKHIPIMLSEVMDGLNIKPNGIYVDGTTGGAGHSFEIASKLKNGKMICIDRDTEALKAAKERLSDFKNITFVHDNFFNIKEILSELKIDAIDGMLCDLGVSSYQIDNAERGFSYSQESELDMRMDQTQSLTAGEVVNTYSEERLIHILRVYGEENFAKNIASNIVRERLIKQIDTSTDLKKIIDASIPARFRFKGGSPYKRTFQALRIEVNSELDELEKALSDAFNALKKGGRLAIITFHSLEDRIVKQLFNKFCKGCICEESSPICTCHHEPEGKLINKKPLVASDIEQKENTRSQSAKLRVIEKII